jgi:hypothetical protein
VKAIIVALVLLVTGTVWADDPASLSGMTLWWDERAFSPVDGAAATTIELDDAGARSYAELLSVAKETPERGRYFGQPDLYYRPPIILRRGWRAPLFSHRNTGHGDQGSGRSLIQINHNGSSTTELQGALDNFIPAGPTPYAAFAVFELPHPSAMVKDENYTIFGTPDWKMYLLWDHGTRLSLYMQHQGAVTGTVVRYVDLTAAGLTGGELLAVCAWWDGKNVRLEVRKPDGTFVTSPPGAVDGLGRTQTGYRLGIGGVNRGLDCYEGPIFAGGITTNAAFVRSETSRRALLDWLNTKYTSSTTATFPDYAAPLAPTAVRPEHLRLWQGAYRVSDGAVDTIANAGRAPVSLAASGTQRPTKTMFGKLDAFSLNGSTQWFELQGGVESNVFNADQITVIGALSCTPNDQHPRGVQSGPAVLYGASSAAFGIVYGLGEGFPRGPMSFHNNGTAGPHGGHQVFTTLIGAFGYGNVERPVVYANVLTPALSIDGSPALVRARAGGTQQSDYASSNKGDHSGAVLVGKRGTFLLKASKVIVPAVWDVALTHAEIQQVESWLKLQIGLMAKSDGARN